MRQQVIDRIAEDLRRFRVVSRWTGYEIIDTKGATRFGGYDRVRDVSGAARFFRNKGRAQKVADKLEAEYAESGVPEREAETLKDAPAGSLQHEQKKI